MCALVPLKTVTIQKPFSFFYVHVPSKGNFSLSDVEVMPWHKLKKRQTVQNMYDIKRLRQKRLV